MKGDLGERSVYRMGETSHRFKAVAVDVSTVNDDPEAMQIHDLWGGSRWQHPAGRSTINPDKLCRELRAVMVKNGYVEVE